MKDFEEYYPFTGPARISKAVNHLEGLLQGISIDNELNSDELQLLYRYLEINRDLVDRHPFNELLPPLRLAIENQRLSQDDHSDLVWLCKRLSEKGSYYSDATAKIQKLQGILSGIIADNIVTIEELNGLRDWLMEHEDLKTIYPYTEVDSFVTAVLEDGNIDAAEHATLLSLFDEFSGLNTRPKRPVNDALPQTITGICAVDPPISVAGSVFYLSGESEKCSKNEFAELIRNAGGVWHPNVTRKTDYVVVGAAGNPCWSYACYGRKIEYAVKLRQQGSQILIVHEYDAWDAIEELGSI